MSRAVITALLIAFLVVATEWLGKRRQEVIMRVVMLMGLVIYTLWRFAPS